MAEDYAPLFRSIWGDEDWRARTPAAQHLYMALFSHPSRNAAGLLPLTPRKWTRIAAGLTPASITASLTELDDTGFLVVDDHTEEVLVRSYVRRAKVYTHIRLFTRALREISEVESPRLRSAIGQELVRLPKLTIPTREPYKSEAEATQLRLDELASMLCDAPPETPAHAMAQGISHGMAHPPGIGAGTGAGVGTGAVLGSSPSRDLKSVEGDAGARGLTNVVQGRWAR